MVSAATGKADAALGGSIGRIGRIRRIRSDPSDLGIRDRHRLYETGSVGLGVGDGPAAPVGLIGRGSNIVMTTVRINGHFHTAYNEHNSTSIRSLLSMLLLEGVSERCTMSAIDTIPCIAPC